MKTLRDLISACLLITATSMFGQRPLIKVNVPFPFTVASRTFPAGEYLITTLTPERTIRIASIKGEVAKIQAVWPLYAQHVSETSRLVLNRYGDVYFLAEIWTAGRDAAFTVPQGKREIEMGRNRSKVRTVLALSTGP